MPHDQEGGSARSAVPQSPFNLTQLPYPLPSSPELELPVP